MTMDFIQVDQDKCTRCGICADVCPGVIGMGNHGPGSLNIAPLPVTSRFLLC